MRGPTPFWGGAPFDPISAELEGPAMPVLRNVFVGPGGQVQMSVADDGTLVYESMETGFYEWSLVLVNGDEEATLPIQPSGYVAPAFSPDGATLTVTLQRREDADLDLAVVDIAKGTLTPITSEGRNLSAVWSPDGSSLVFASDRDGPFNLYRMPSNGAGEVERLTTSPRDQFPFSWSPDGEHILFMQRGSTRDIWAVRANVSESGDSVSEPFALLESELDETAPAFSPDGRQFAYTVVRDGHDEVWVRNFPDGGGAQRISRRPGGSPVWSSDGRDLFYRSESQKTVIRVSLANGTESELSVPLSYPGYVNVAGSSLRPFALAPDGRLVYVNTGTGSRKLNLVTNWFTELRALAPPSP